MGPNRLHLRDVRYPGPPTGVARENDETLFRSADTEGIDVRFRKIGGIYRSPNCSHASVRRIRATSCSRREDEAMAVFKQCSAWFASD